MGISDARATVKEGFRAGGKDYTMFRRDKIIPQSLKQLIPRKILNWIIEECFMSF